MSTPLTPTTSPNPFANLGYDILGDEADETSHLLQWYDQRVSAVSQFEERSSKIFSQDKDKIWLEFCFADSRPKTPVSAHELERIHYVDQLDRFPKFIQAAFFAPFTINSLGRISPSRELFDALNAKFNVTPRFKEFIMSFGFKRRENDFGPPTLRFRMVGKPEAEKDSKTGAFYGPSFECVYGFRYAFKTRNLGLESDSWSMRQTAVYQKFDAKENRVVWIIIGGSSDTIDLIRKNIAQSSRGSELKPFLLHAMIIENSLGEWRLYIADLASRVHSMSEKFALSDISATSPEERINISVSFSDRQKLNTLEDQVLNLRTMLQSSLQTIASLKTHCVTIVSSQAEFYEQQSILNIFDEASSQASSYLTKVDVLRRLVKSATTLLTDILTYDNASILKLLAEEARIDNVAMIQLSKQAAEDSRAIRVITIITVVFLPATVVSSFFSTQFVHIELDSFRLSSSTWVYFAVTAVLTLITVGSWMLLPIYAPKLREFLTNTRRQFGDQKRRVVITENKRESSMSALRQGTLSIYQQRTGFSQTGTLHTREIHPEGV